MSMKRPTSTRSLPGEKGQAIILIIFSVIGLIGMAALAIDGGNAYIDSRRAETAASAAALTAALTRIEGGDWRAAALATAAANGYNNDGVTNTVELNTPPISGPYSDSAEYIEVIVTSRLQTYFGSVIGIPFITNVATVISQSKPAEVGEMFNGYALVSLAPKSDCDKNRAFAIYGEATINFEGGGLFVNSDNPDCAFVSYGSGSIRMRDDSPITIVGGAQVQKPQLITPYPFQTGSAFIPYPPPYIMPKASCGTKLAEMDEFGVMSPGNWEEDVFPPDGAHSLSGGVYCLSGDFIFDSGVLEGGGVTIVVMDGDVRIGSNAEINLSAPKSGPNEGLLFYMPFGNRGVMLLNGTIDAGYTGTILAPSAHIRINGPDSVKGAAFHSQIIGHTIESNSQSDIVIKYKDEQNYDSIKMPEVILIK